VRVRQRRGQVGLPNEPLPKPRVSHIGTKDLQRILTRQMRMPPQIHLTHPPGPQEPNNGVTSKHLTTPNMGGYYRQTPGASVDLSCPICAHIGYQLGHRTTVQTGLYRRAKLCAAKSRAPHTGGLGAGAAQQHRVRERTPFKCDQAPDNQNPRCAKSVLKHRYSPSVAGPYGHGMGAELGISVRYGIA
jgi:hypothetical protein